MDSGHDADLVLAGWSRLWSAVRVPEDSHPVEPWALGEYAALLQARDPTEAARVFPAIAAHLASPCDACAADLAELVAMVAQERESGFVEPPSYPRGTLERRPAEPSPDANTGTAYLELPGGERFVLDRPRVVIGRDRDNDVAFTDAAVSRSHASLERVPGGWLLRDWDSANGVWVNGERVSSCVLHDGDVILMGQQRVLFRSSRS